MNDTLYLVRGLPGAGKSTLAEQLASENAIFEADMWMIDTNGNYDFDPRKLRYCHMCCLRATGNAMRNNVSSIVVSNTNTTDKELAPYLELAESYGYRVVSLVVENRHGNSSIHDVPESTLDSMEERFVLKLR